MKENEYTETQHKILQELYKAVRRLGGDMELLGAVGSIGDTLEDYECLELLQDWNNNHPISSH